MNELIVILYFNKKNTHIQSLFYKFNINKINKLWTFIQIWHIFNVQNQFSVMHNASRPLIYLTEFSDVCRYLNIHILTIYNHPILRKYQAPE